MKPEQLALAVVTPVGYGPVRPSRAVARGLCTSCSVSHCRSDAFGSRAELCERCALAESKRVTSS